MTHLTSNCCKAEVSYLGVNKYMCKGCTHVCTPIESPEEIIDATPTNTPADYANLPATECKGTCEEEKGGWEERFEILSVDVHCEDCQDKIKSFLRSELATALQSQRTEMLKAVEEVEKLVEQIRETDLAIRKADKTPKYEYSRNRCNANRDGEFPEGGARWAMPYELSSGLLRNAESTLTAVRESLSA